MFLLTILVLCFNFDNMIAITIGGGTYCATSYSKFDFEEKVLEKLVRLEHKIEIFEQKQQTWENNIELKMDKVKKTEKKLILDMEIAIDNITKELDRQKHIVIDTLQKREQAANSYIESQMDRLKNATENISQKIETFTAKQDIENQVKTVQSVRSKYDNQTKEIYDAINEQFKKMNESEIRRDTSFLSFTKSTQNVLDDYQKNIKREIENFEQSVNNTLISFRQYHSNKVAVTACTDGTSHSHNSVILFPHIQTLNGKLSNGIMSLGSTGKFVCERPGLYLITAFIMTNTDSSRVTLYKNAYFLTNIYFTKADFLQTNSITLLEQLNVNDSVYIKTFESMYIHGVSSSCMSILQITG